MDEALCLPTQEAVQIALRTQQVIGYEIGVTDTVDPLAGSYYVESLTRDICERAKVYIKKIDEMGGSPEAIEKGYIQKEIQDSAFKFQREIEEEKRIVVGLNRFQMEEEKVTDLLRVNPAVRISQIEKLKKLKSERNATKVKESLAALKKAAQGDDNLMPFILDSVKAYATLGEICEVLKEVFGEYGQPSAL
jgi:methylmalonyl-CoA mutase N-terminal domain/subunit